MEPQEIDMSGQLAERFAELPKVVQDAITSADVQKRLRDLAETHKLHVDQWQVLENNVMLSLLGFQAANDLPTHLEKDLGITPELATELATSISAIVFAPIRAEMERILDHPSATEESSAMDTMQAAAIREAQGDEVRKIPVQSTTPVASVPTPSVAPATPPPPPPTEKVVRGTIAPAYVGTPSHARKTVEGDPYREQLT